VGTSGIALTEFAARRARVLRELGNAGGVVFAGERTGHGRWRADGNFRYLTGIEDEPGAAVVFDPSAEDPRRRVVLLLRPMVPEVDRWEGHRAMLGEALEARYGFDTVLRTTALPMLLTGAARRLKRLACLHPFAVYDAPASPDLLAFRKVMERVPGVTVDDRTAILRGMRPVKSPVELVLMRRAIDATAAGFAAACGVIRPGAGERAVHAALERGFADAGGTGTAYESIVGSGVRGTVLHYTANDGPTEAGDLLVIDAGAEVAGYAADVTRTYPVSGRFSAEQRRLYGVVLAAQEAAIRAVRPGATMSAVDAAARGVIRNAGLADAFCHSIGHHLGLEVHDLNAEAPFAPGMVVTIEPGVYLPATRTGIRIEDDVLVTRGGREVMTAMIPKSVEAVEAALSGAR
jgi:Xaa-Pro aminopeptidase